MAVHNIIIFEVKKIVVQVDDSNVDMGNYHTAKKHGEADILECVKSQALLNIGRLENIVSSNIQQTHFFHKDSGPLSIVINDKSINEVL